MNNEYKNNSSDGYDDDFEPDLDNKLPVKPKTIQSKTRITQNSTAGLSYSK